MDVRPVLTHSDHWFDEWRSDMDDRELRERGLGAVHAAALAVTAWLVVIAGVWLIVGWL